MPRVRILAIVVLLVSYGAVGARQPAVRSAVPLPVSANAIAGAAGLPSANSATLLLHLVRLLYDGPARADAPAARLWINLQRLLLTSNRDTTDVVPLPLDPSIWRETLLQTNVSDDRIVASILADRRASLLYHGLFALDDDTLGWLGADRDTLLRLRDHAGVFAAFGRSIRVRAGRVVVPGGPEAEALWEALTGTSPAKPAAFVQRVFSEGDGWLAFFYDTVAHFDAAHQRFALGLQLPSGQQDRLQALLDAFGAAVHTWRPERQPFSRPTLDASVVLTTIALTSGGEAAGPVARRVWEQVFQNDERLEMKFSPVSAADVPKDPEAPTVDAAWLASRIGAVPYSVGRRRLDTFLFAQRVFAEPRPPDPAVVATALRGFGAFPALALTLERIGVTDPAVFVRAVNHAVALSAIPSEAVRRASIAQFQGAITIVERARRSGALSESGGLELLSTLCGIDLTDQGYEGRLARWLRARLVPALAANAGEPQPVESIVLAAIAGPAQNGVPATVVDWEGQRYRVDPAMAEFRRLQQVRARQGGLSLDDALEGMAHGEAVEARRPAARGAAMDGERRLAETLTSIVYAVHLGDPDGQAVTSGNVALRHDFGIANTKAGMQSSDAWRLPIEDFGTGRGWRVRGAILGLETAIGRLALKRLDPSTMPPEPKLASADRQVAALTAALLNPYAMSDAARDEIAAALGRGRARATALSGDPAELDAVARQAGLSEWRRQALAWTVTHDRADAARQLSPVELFWLGSPRLAAVRSLDAWGAAVLPLTGCLCLQMPGARPWEDLTGRPATGILATRTADVAVQVADTLAALGLPATLAPYVIGFAMQEVTEQARPAYNDDWAEFGRAARDLPRNQIADFVAALTSRGPLVPADLVPSQRQDPR